MRRLPLFGMRGPIELAEFVIKATLVLIVAVVFGVAWCYGVCVEAPPGGATALTLEQAKERVIMKARIAQMDWADARGYLTPEAMEWELSTKIFLKSLEHDRPVSSKDCQRLARTMMADQGFPAADKDFYYPAMESCTIDDTPLRPVPIPVVRRRLEPIPAAPF